MYNGIQSWTNPQIVLGLVRAQLKHQEPLVESLQNEFRQLELEHGMQIRVPSGRGTMNLCV